MNRALSLVLSAAVALSPLAPPAAAEEVVISPLPIQGALVDPCAAGGDRAKCTGAMSAAGSGNVRGGGSKPVLYRRLQWREIDSRSITEDEYAALICKLNRENCDGDLRNPGVLEKKTNMNRGKNYLLECRDTIVAVVETDVEKNHGGKYET